ncbi:hypothetical protein CC86DRAFT_413389 [Ophiobolus disseminans]|uniref:Uncharacterized protein n=1 Tax=Ophiobolus disseminans TaxID=1469910 RepID=A0A6A6ZE95_9PLEO|nr:hypothetical protein CC86DRAFT_413389 [Ophiobolus disseminans]
MAGNHSGDDEIYSKGIPMPMQLMVRPGRIPSLQDTWPTDDSQSIHHTSLRPTQSPSLHQASGTLSTQAFPPLLHGHHGAPVPQRSTTSDAEDWFNYMPGHVLDFLPSMLNQAPQFFQVSNVSDEDIVVVATMFPVDIPYHLKKPTLSKTLSTAANLSILSHVISIRVGAIGNGQGYASDGKANSSKYGAPSTHDLGLCWEMFCTTKACRFGAHSTGDMML